jgi:cell filamentation protein, protein adenylyltransferase
MGWTPNYTITDKLIFTIRHIGEAMGAIKAVTLPKRVLAQLELEARALSSHASTSIEGNPLGLTDVRKLLKSRPQYIRDTEREILNYNKALESIYKAIKSDQYQFNIAGLEKTQRAVVDGLMDDPSDIGRLRKKHVVIRDPRRPDAIVFMPPNWVDVPELSQELLSFVNNGLGRIDPIILAGLFHRQCVIIHPFMDGNGRSTRLMTTAILGQGGIDLFEILSFENYYTTNITRYFKAVGLVGDYYELADSIDFTAWLEYFADGILDELKRIQKTLPGSGPVRLEQHLQRLLDYLDEHGSLTQAEYGRLTNRSLASRKNDFKKLINLGLIEARGGGRSTYYVLSKG